MDLQSFLRLLLPADGVKFLAEWVSIPDHKRGGVFNHYPFENLDDMASKAQHLSARNKNIYFACAAYNEVIWKEGKNGKKYATGRTQDNALGAQALWLDIDVGKSNDTNSYKTQKEASEDIKKLCTLTGLHRPMVISSGNGFHCYWLFDRFVEKAEWNALATTFREVTKRCELKVDPSRDKDIASVLRPPETVNPKGNKPVKVLKQSEAKAPSYYRTLFSEFLGVEAPPAHAVKKLGNSLATPVSYPPSSLNRIAEHCQTIQFFKKTGASAFEPLWRGCLGIAKHTYDGEELAHEWSAQDERYDKDETQAKLDAYNSGPTLCETFKGMSESCKGCKHAVTSPVQLGYSAVVEGGIEPAKASTYTEKLEESVDRIISEVPNLWPDNVRVTDNKMGMMLVDKDTSVPYEAIFAVPKFWPEDRLRMEDGTYSLACKMEVKPGRFREFDLPMKYIVDGRSMRQCLAASEVIILNEKCAMEYIQSYADRLRRHLEEVNTYDQFGWTKDKKGILLGNKLLTENGITEVRLSEKLRSLRVHEDMFTVSGTKQEWIDGVNTLYNTFPHSEPYQYSIATQFGAWLCHVMESEEWNGIPLAVTSSDPGQSKTTAIKVGINACINASTTMISDATIKAMIIRISSMGSVPILFDEVTGFVKTGEDMSTLAYTLSNGRGRIGSTTDGKERAPIPPFKVMSSMTSNKSAQLQLTESKVNPEATQVRIFEIALEDYPQLEILSADFKDKVLKGKHQEIANHLVNKVYGVLGEEYLTYLIANREEIRKLLDTTFNKLVVVVGNDGGNSSKERFYIRHVACAMVGLQIATKLGYLSFNVKNLMRWAVQHIRKLRNKTEAMNGTAIDKLSTMMSFFSGAMIVTKQYEKLDGRAGVVEEPMLAVFNTIVGRLVLGSKNEAGRIIISANAVKEWCTKNNVDPQEFKRELLAKGYLKNNGIAKNMYIAKGVPSKALGVQKCLELSFDKMQGYVTELAQAADISNVVQINQGETDGSNSTASTA
jgi:hypothetical protein